MRYLSAYMLLQMGGKEEPTAADLEKVIKSVGVTFEKDKAEQVCKMLKGKKVPAVIAAGTPPSSLSPTSHTLSFTITTLHSYLVY